MTTDNHALPPSDGALKAQLKDKSRRRRRAVSGLTAQSAGPLILRNDLLPPLELVSISLSELKVPPRNIRKIDPIHVREVANSMAALGVCRPVIVGKSNRIVDGAIIVEAAKLLGLERVPCVRVDHLSDVEERVLRAALNRLGEKGEWDIGELKLEFEELILTEAPLEISGFSITEFDQIVHGEVADGLEKGPVEPEANKVAVARLGDVFNLGAHRVICGDAREPAVLAEVSKGDPPVDFVFTDTCFNVKIKGNVTRGNHSEFVMASGEMSDEQFQIFNEGWMGAALPLLRDGGLFGSFIDWRGFPIIHAAAMKVGLTALNLIVWTKTNAGMGSLYRSQHELLPLFKNGTAPHVNNVALGSKGRWRSNVWNYPGASTIGSDARRGLKDHPTVKPTAMLEDALLDITNRGDIVLDPFLGSGSTLMAAEKTGRVCRGIELAPLYIDVIVRRYESVTGNTAILVETGETFAALAARRAGEAAAGAPSKVDGEGATAALV